MTYLTAVCPDGSSVIHADGESGEGSGVGRNGHEAGVETDLSGSRGRGQRTAGSVEGGLRDGVVLHHELEGDSVANLCSDIGRREDKI